MSALNRRLKKILHQPAPVSMIAAELETLIREREQAAAGKAWHALADVVFPLYEAAEHVLIHNDADRQMLMAPLATLARQTNPYRREETE